MIIDHVYNPNLVPYLDDNHTDFKGKIIKSPSTYKLVSEHSEYVKNNDAIYYEVGFKATHLRIPIDKVLSQDQIRAIKDKKVLLLVDLSLETIENQIPELYENLIVRDQIPADQVVLLSHTLDYVDRIKKYAELYNCPLIKYEYYPYWIRLQQVAYKNDCDTYGASYLDHKNSGLFSVTSKKFLLLNNNWKEHRIALLCLLNKYDLLKDSYTSFSGKPEREGLYKRLLNSKQPIPDWLKKEQTNTTSENWNVWLTYTTEQFNALKEDIMLGSNIGEKLPLLLDIKNFPLNIAYIQQTHLLRFYRNTYFSVVTESGYKNNIETHITEKPFKAITYKHPFIYCSHPYSLEKIRNMGYKTFDGIIDESYDRELDPNKRMMMIVDEVKKLCNLSVNELINFKQACLPIVEYNFQRFINEKSFIQKVL